MLKQALCAGLINLLFSVAMFLATWIYISSSGMMSTLGIGCCLLAQTIFSFMKHYLWPQILLFRLPLRNNYKNAFIFAFLNPRNNLLIGFVNLVCYALAALLLYVPFLLSSILVVLMGTCFFPGSSNFWFNIWFFPS